MTYFFDERKTQFVMTRDQNIFEIKLINPSVPTMTKFTLLFANYLLRETNSNITLQIFAKMQ